MLRKRYHQLIVFILLIIFVGALFIGAAQAQVELAPEIAQATDIRIVIARIVQVFLGLLGTIGVSLIIYAGYVWMTAGGNEEKITQAKRILLNAGIGLAITLSAFGIASFVLSRLQQSVGGSAGLQGPGGPPAFFGALGGGIIESHLPERNASGVPRNTKIIVTFKEPMQLSSIINDQDNADPADDVINVDNIKIRRTIDDATDGPFVTNARAATTEDHQTFVFAPEALLGSPSENIPYTVELGAGVTKANGDSAFGAFGTYRWEFEVSTLVDNTPPKVENVIPITDSTTARNSIVQITFDEAIDPTTVSGTVAQGFNKILVQNVTDGSAIAGTFRISNQYRTVEFVTDDLCGTNSCGGDVFCLPADKSIRTVVKAASLENAGPTASFPYDGVVDVAGNSLDGNGDGDTDGPGLPPERDHYVWSFNTTNQIDLTPPTITTVRPNPFASNIDLELNPEADFSKPMMSSSLNSTNVRLQGATYWITSQLQENNGQSFSRVNINHDSFEEDSAFAPTVSSNVQDVFQNCYQPCVGP